MAIKIPGEEISDIRSSFGLSATQFAQVLGVHPSTVHRWESAGPQSVPVDGVAANLLIALRQRPLLSDREGAQVGDRIAQALIVGGALVALAALIEWLTKSGR